MTAIHIRRATLGDAEHLVEFNAAMALETEAKTLAPAVLRAGVARVLAEAARGFYLIAECDGAIAGCLMITYEWSDWRNGDWWWFQSVYVLPAFRRDGVFRALFAEVQRMAQAITECHGHASTSSARTGARRIPTPRSVSPRLTIGFGNASSRRSEGRQCSDVQ